jgi:hypothetical protein
MAVKQAIVIAKRDKDSEALRKAYDRGKAIGLSPKYMGKIGTSPTDVYLFSSLPKADQAALLRQATPEERKTYCRRLTTNFSVPCASSSTKLVSVGGLYIRLGPQLTKGMIRGDPQAANLKESWFHRATS